MTLRGKSAFSLYKFTNQRFQCSLTNNTKEVFVKYLFSSNTILHMWLPRMAITKLCLSHEEYNQARKSQIVKDTLISICIWCQFSESIRLGYLLGVMKVTLKLRTVKRAPDKGVVRHSIGAQKTQRACSKNKHNQHTEVKRGASGLGCRCLALS